jgi:hypothetical protein
VSRTIRIYIADNCDKEQLITLGRLNIQPRSIDGILGQHMKDTDTLGRTLISDI